VTTDVLDLDGDEGGLVTARRLNGTRLSGRKLVVTLDRREAFRKDVDLNDQLKECNARQVLALHAARTAPWSACNVATALHRLGTCGVIRNPKCTWHAQSASSDEGRPRRHGCHVSHLVLAPRVIHAGTERGAGAEASGVDALLDHATAEIRAGSVALVVVVLAFQSARLGHTLRSFDARGLATASWAAGRLSSERGSFAALFDAVIAASSPRLRDMKTMELANLAHGQSHPAFPSKSVPRGLPLSREDHQAARKRAVLN
jgi:hypothetical protein